VEELETTNEELQSTNEELETTNEELQSTNEELQTINEELRQRSGALNQVNAFLESILTGLRAGVVVLDRDLHVQVWNGQSQELWGLRADEVQGRPLLSLDIGLPMDQILPAIRAQMASPGGHQEATVDARNRRGRAIRCRVSVSTLNGSVDDIHGVILLMEELNGLPERP
jgi:two-component system CheB/CheR fusion protein